MDDRWLLPEGVEELLPDQARRLEAMRRGLLDLFDGWGYELVTPPLIEFLDSLFTGLGRDLDLQTFKLTDQLTGRLMGLRADMTPQVARIEAHYLKRSGPVRLCYLGPVLRTRPGSLGEPRELMQLGAELFGHAGPESDTEIIELLVETLNAAGIESPHLAMGHVGIYRELLRESALPDELEQQYFDALRRKSRPDISALLADADVDVARKTMLTGLIDLQGEPAKVLERARSALAGAGEPVRTALDNLAAVVERVSGRAPRLPLYLDLTELRGYRYHTGVVFSAYAPGQGQAVAHGGRYDAIGKAFGEARPATGFSTDLRSLLRVVEGVAGNRKAILAPADEDPQLDEKLHQLRAAGERVLRELPGLPQADVERCCDRRVVKSAKGWSVVKL